MQGTKVQSEKVKLSFAGLAVFVYVVGVGAFAYLFHATAPQHQPTILTLATSFVAGGALKLINIFQNQNTDKKVTEDLSTTKEVKHQLNGGFEEKVAEGVKKALAERDKEK
jgi:DNA integrity scanning protein DisA with diadenylate cyclase activity